MNEKIRLAKDYFRFRLAARSRYTIHSSFLFELVNDVFRDKRNFYAFEEIEKIREELLNDGSAIDENFQGAASKKLSQKREVKNIVEVSAMPVKYCRLLFNLILFSRPKTILELGTGLGLSTFYMAAAARSAKIISIEGSEKLSAIAQKKAQKLQLQNIKFINGKFSETLPQALQELQTLDFVLIDGDHAKQPLLQNLRQIIPHVTNNCVIVIDDIYWSAEMKDAWSEIIQFPQVTLSLDLFRLGILFFREGIVKQHLKVVW